MKPKDSVSEETKEINLGSKKEIMIEDYFEMLLSIFATYLDYYESDLGMYLTNKFVRKFPTYIFIRIIVLLGITITIFLSVFFENIIISLVSSVISLLFIYLYSFIDKQVSKKERITVYFIQGRRKTLTLFKNQLNLFSNNTYLSERYTTESFEFDVIQSKLNSIKSRIENDIEIIHPYSYYLLNIGLPILLALLFAPLVNLIINIIPNISAIPIQINLDLIIQFILNLMPLVLMIFVNYRMLKSIMESRKLKEKSVYFICEILIFGIFELLRQKLRSKEFPNEEELPKEILKTFSSKTLTKVSPNIGTKSPTKKKRKKK